ncbi:MAG: hypothetical protein ACOX63_09955 [Christensenellales bacterium]|jgi:hypothetical protein
MEKSEIKRILDGFPDRRDKAIQALAGEPLIIHPIEPPYEKGRPRLARGYSYSILNFVFKVFLLNEEKYFQDADDALRKNCELYIHDARIRDDRDSFYWSIDLLCRIIEFYGERGTVCSGRLNRDTEALCCQMMLVWLKKHSRMQDAETESSRTWYVWESENHHLQRFSTCWHLARILKHAGFQSKALDDGFSILQHHQAWTDYAKEYFKERARKSLFIETNNSFYGLHSLKGIYNFFDFSDDPELKRLSSMFLTLYWAVWAQEQLDGVRGGGKARIYPGAWSLLGDDPLRRLAWYYLNIGAPCSPVENELTILTSEYRLPEIVADIALDAEGRSDYEIIQQPLGLAADGCYLPAPDYHVRTDWGGIQRYSYCTPEFILGTLITESLPYESWTLISSQNKWQGAVFSDDPDARIVLQCETADAQDPAVLVKRAYNSFVSIQKECTLITQKSRYAKDTLGMRVWFSSSLGKPQFRGGWYFTSADHAYAAVKILRGSGDWNRETGGRWLVCSDGTSPVILCVAKAKDYPDLSAFEQRILSCPLSYDRQVLSFTDPAGHHFSFDGNQEQHNMIDSIPAPQQTPFAFQSPYVIGKWDSGSITIQKGQNTLSLVFS